MNTILNRWVRTAARALSLLAILATLVSHSPCAQAQSIGQEIWEPDNILYQFDGSAFQPTGIERRISADNPAAFWLYDRTTGSALFAEDFSYWLSNGWVILTLPNGQMWYGPWEHSFIHPLGNPYTDYFLKDGKWALLADYLPKQTALAPNSITFDPTNTESPHASRKQT
jgi:hypothetical protein